MVNYWDKYTEMHGQQNIKKCFLLLLAVAVVSYLYVVRVGTAYMYTIYSYFYVVSFSP